MRLRLARSTADYRHDAFDERLKRICADRLLAEAGRLVVEQSVYRFSGFEPVAVDLLADWTADPHAQRNWQLNTAALTFLPWLIARHARFRDPEALPFALRAIRSWRDAAAGALRDYEFARHDHATALRAENAMLLLSYLHRRGLHEDAWAELEAFVDELAAMLETAAFYNRHTNHGIEQSRILALAADLLPGRAASARRWRLAMRRLDDELRFAFTADGVHVENSPGYHHYVCNAFLKIVATFPGERLGELGRAIDATMPKTMRFLVHVVRPDGTLPIIGDTEGKRAVNPFRRYAEAPEYRWLEFVASRRRRGRPPLERVAVFPDAGYLIARDRWTRPEAPGREFHFILKCGFRSRYHRHDDDFNIVLVCGEDWLIDGGAHSYAEDAPVRRYLRSKWAHNVPVIDPGQDRWPRSTWPPHAARLDVETRDGGVVATAESGGYDGYRATRRVELTPSARRFTVEDALDPLHDAGPVQFRSLWHVPAKRDVFRRGQDILVRSRINTQAMLIRNLGASCDTVGVFRPGLERYANAVTSRRAHHLEPARIVAFSTRADAFSCRLGFEMTDIEDLAGWERL